MLKEIVHPKMKILCLSAYLKGNQDLGDFVSSVEHKQRFLTQTVAVCQSYNAYLGKNVDRQRGDGKETTSKSPMRYSETVCIPTNNLLNLPRHIIFQL